MHFLSWLFDRRRSCAECSLNERQSALLAEERGDMAFQLRGLEFALAAARAAAHETELVCGFLAEQRSTFEARVNELTDLLARERRWNEELRTELRLTRGNVITMTQLEKKPRGLDWPDQFAWMEKALSTATEKMKSLVAKDTAAEAPKYGEQGVDVEEMMKRYVEHLGAEKQLEERIARMERVLS